MKEFLIITKCKTLGPLSYNGFIIESVKGKEFAPDSRFFAYHNPYDKKVYLVDKASGLSIGYSLRWKSLEELVYKPKLKAYEAYIKTQMYKNKVNAFEEMKKEFNYVK